MGTELTFFDQQDSLPAYLQSYASEAATNLMLGAGGRNRLGLKGGRFRLLVNGQEEAVLETSSVEVVIVGAAKGVGRLYFEGNYVEGEKTHPSCYSADGISPGADVVNPQAVKCAMCPQNQKGSKITQEGVKTKACTFFKRLAVVPLMDPEHRVFQMDGKAMTIFGAGEPAQNKFTLSEYANKLKTRGVDVAHLVTKLSFDLKSSVPKVYFSPVRLLTEDEAPWVQDLVSSEQVRDVITITAITDASDTESETEVPAASVAKPQAQAAPVAQAKPKPAPAAPKPAQAAAKPAATLVKAQAAPPPVQKAAVVEAPAVEEVSTGDSELDAFLAQMEE